MKPRPGTAVEASSSRKSAAVSRGMVRARVFQILSDALRLKGDLHAARSNHLRSLLYVALLVPRIEKTQERSDSEKHSRVVDRMRVGECVKIHLPKSIAEFSD